MSHEPGTTQPAGTDQSSSGSPTDLGGLRARGAAADLGGPAKKRGRPPKVPGAPAAAPSEKVSSPAPKPSKNPEFVYSKTGKAFRALGLIAATQQNERGWLINPEEEKDLGEAVGDIFLELGLSDTMAAKVVFAVGTVGAIIGSKALAIQQHRAANPRSPVRPSIPAAVVKPSAPAPT